uniref:Uncharacterized protein n=1 Tax=Neolamprologus brichardi TaxID=32507 RepID=A0A3Q4HIQ2_NEOBR
VQKVSDSIHNTIRGRHCARSTLLAHFQSDETEINSFASDGVHPGGRSVRIWGCLSAEGVGEMASGKSQKLQFLQ